MLRLGRCVRFSIDPFLAADEPGCNSFASKPTGQGLSIFLELCVGLVGRTDAGTGFLVNVAEIDKKAREYVVPVLAEKIRSSFRRGTHIGFAQTAGFLQTAGEILADKFDGAMLSDLSLKLNPFRKIAVDCEDYKMIYFSEKFEFAAMHKLWNNDFSEERNFQVFGKCANPNGHGHNYTVEVTVKMPASEDFAVSGFERAVDETLIRLVDHKNLNADVAEFNKQNPTIENIAVLAWNKLAGRFSDCKLHCITIWETDKTYCSYYG